MQLLVLNKTIKVGPKCRSGYEDGACRVSLFKRIGKNFRETVLEEQESEKDVQGCRS